MNKKYLLILPTTLCLWAILGVAFPSILSQIIQVFLSRTIGIDSLTSAYWDYAWILSSLAAQIISVIFFLSYGYFYFQKFKDINLKKLFMLPVLLFLIILLVANLYRFLSVILLAVAFSFHIVHKYKPQKKISFIIIWVLFIIVSIISFDLSFQNFPGNPRFVPYEMGLLSEEGIEKMNQGEFMSGGCVINGLEPWYVWVW